MKSKNIKFNCELGDIVEFRLLNNHKIDYLVYSTLSKTYINVKGKFILLDINYNKNYYIVLSLKCDKIFILAFQDGVRIQRPMSYIKRNVVLRKVL